MEQEEARSSEKLQDLSAARDTVPLQSLVLPLPSQTHVYDWNSSVEELGLRLHLLI